MAPATFEERPRVDREIVERWPAPDGVPPERWRRWPIKQRNDWLIDHTFTKNEAGSWVVRPEAAGSKTADQVVQAVMTVKGAETVFEPITEQAIMAADFQPDSVKCPNCGHALSRGWSTCPGCGLTGESLNDVRFAGYNTARAVATVILCIILLVVIAALLTDLFGGGDGEETITPASVDVVQDAPEPTSAPVPSEPTATAAEAEPPPATAAPDPAITFSSIPDHVVYAKTWSDGEVAIQLNPDGTYVYRTAGVDETGRFKMTAEGGVDRIEFLDPDDPSGLNVTFQLPVDIISDGSLVYGPDETARVMNEVAVMPEFEAEALPPPQRLDFATAAYGGAIASKHAGLEWPTTGHPGVSYGLEVKTMAGGLDIDIGAGTISGHVDATFGCPDEGCRDPGEEMLSAVATIDVASGELESFAGRWIYRGTATVAFTWDSAIPCTTGSCPWQYSASIDVPYRFELFADLGEGYGRFEFTEGDAGDGITYSVGLSVDPSFVGG